MLLVPGPIPAYAQPLIRLNIIPGLLMSQSTILAKPPLIVLEQAVLPPLALEQAVLPPLTLHLGWQMILFARP